MEKEKDKNFLCLVFLKRHPQTPVKFYSDKMEFLNELSNKIDYMQVYRNTGKFFKFCFEVRSSDFPIGVVDFYVKE